MHLKISDPRAHEPARRLADCTGETLTEAVIQALEQRLARLDDSRAARRRGRAAAIERAVMRFQALPVIDERSPDQLIGYGADGLPN